MAIFRCFSNCYFFLKQTIYDFEGRNLGYISRQQKALSVYFRSKTIDWLVENKMNLEKISKYIGGDIDKAISIISTVSSGINTNCVVELYSLNKIMKIPIIVWKGDEGLYVFDDGIVDDKEAVDEIIKKVDKKLYINIQFSMDEGNNVPYELRSIYYI